MRFIFGMGSRLFIWETSVSKVAMRVAGGDDAPEEEEEYKDAPPQDPHGVLHCQAELSPQAIFEGAKAGRRFGFGREAGPV